MASVYGRNAARTIARDLAAQGLLVVSGGAAGIDTEAHLGALDAGSTAAVLGSGIDVVYPRENAGLFDRIRGRGVLVSEFPFGTGPDRYNFPRRNRLISGLSFGVVVVEAAKRSGSLITANFAMEQGRDVFAVPGEIGAHFSEGTNNLIKQGGRLVDSALDILEALEFERPRPAEAPPAPPPSGQTPGETRPAAEGLSDVEEAVLAFLGDDVRTVDAVLNGLAAGGFQVKDVESALLMLELKDRVRQEIGKRFKRI
jgi:DNA processing protein